MNLCGIGSQLHHGYIDRPPITARFTGLINQSTETSLDTGVTDCKLARESEGCRNNTDNIPSQDYTAPEDDQKLIYLH